MPFKKLEELNAEFCASCFVLSQEKFTKERRAFPKILPPPLKNDFKFISLAMLTILIFMAFLSIGSCFLNRKSKLGKDIFCDYEFAANMVTSILYLLFEIALIIRIKVNAPKALYHDRLRFDYSKVDKINDLRAQAQQELLRLLNEAKTHGELAAVKFSIREMLNQGKLPIFTHDEKIVGSILPCFPCCHTVPSLFGVKINSCLPWLKYILEITREKVEEEGVRLPLLSSGEKSSNCETFHNDEKPSDSSIVIRSPSSPSSAEDDEKKYVSSHT